METRREENRRRTTSETDRRTSSRRRRALRPRERGHRERNDLALPAAPQNTEKSRILLKVAAINQLYSTNIYDVQSVAEQIAKLDIDSKLDAGSIELVDAIARIRLGENKHFTFRSFASKYCSWHRPKSYAIYDSRARECLWAYKRQFNLSFVHDGLWEYIPFFDAVKEFRDRFDLPPLNFKEIDKFLFLQGADLIKSRAQAKAAANEARAFENPKATTLEDLSVVTNLAAQQDEE